MEAIVLSATSTYSSNMCVVFTYFVVNPYSNY